MSLPFFSDSNLEPIHRPTEVNETEAFQQSAPDPVFMEIEHLVYEIRQSGATKLLVKKMSTALRAYEAIVRMEKRLVHVRLVASLAQIDATHQAENLQPEAAKPDGLPTIQEEHKPDDDSENETQELIEEQLEIINGLPKLGDRKLIILFAARVITAYRWLCKLDESLVKETKIANKVFMKVIDVLEPEWIQYVRDKSFDPTQVNLSVIAEFLQEEALKEANRMPLHEVNDK